MNTQIELPEIPLAMAGDNAVSVTLSSGVTIVLEKTILTRRGRQYPYLRLRALSP